MGGGRQIKPPVAVQCNPEGISQQWVECRARREQTHGCLGLFRISHMHGLLDAADFSAAAFGIWTTK
jgi:hypothetical protein